MPTIPLTMHGIAWCWHHGHPIVGLCARPNEVFWITLATDDAQAMSPLYQGHNTGRARVYGLLESTIEGLGARIASVALGFSETGVLRASLTLEGLFGRQTRPVHAVDAIVLASRGQLTIEMEEQDLRRACAGDQELGHTFVSEPDAGAPEPFRSFIESLDLGHFDQPGASHGPE